MITVVSVNEVKKLMAEGELVASENIEFLFPETVQFVSEVLKANKEIDAAQIIYLQAADGKEAKELTTEELEDVNSGFLSYLPQLEEDQVCFIVDIKAPDCILVPSDVLDELDGSDLSDEKLKEEYSQLILKEELEDVDCVYAFAGTLKLDSVKEILYPPHLEEVITELKELGNTRKVLFKKTTLFGQEE